MTTLIAHEHGTLYIMDEHGTPRPCSCPLEWARWMATNKPIVQMDVIHEDVAVITLFMGISCQTPPEVFATKIIARPGSWAERFMGCYGRSVTRVEALRTHRAAIMSVSYALG